MGYNIPMGVGIRRVYHYRNDRGCGIEWTEGKLIALSLEECNHCIEIVYVQSHAEEAEILNLL